MSENHVAEKREPELPSDRQCLACGAVIEHGDRCLRVDAIGSNEYGDFDKWTDHHALICKGCTPL